MAIFVVFRVADHAKMRSAILSRYTDDHLELENGEWLISAKGNGKRRIRRPGSHKRGIPHRERNDIQNGQLFWKNFHERMGLDKVEAGER